MPEMPGSRFAPTLSALANAMRPTAPRSVMPLPERFANLLSGELALESVLRGVLEEMATAAQADRGFIALLDPEGEFVECRVLGQEGDPRQLFPHCKTVIERMRVTQVPVWIPDARRDPSLNASDSVVALDLHAVLVVPLKIGPSVVGLLYMDRRRPLAQADTPDLGRLEGLAAYAALAIHQARSTSEMASSLQKLRLINDVSLAINATLKLDELLKLVLQHSLSLSGGEQGFILLGDRSDLTCLASLDKDGHPVEQVGISRSIVARCIEGGRSICILDTHEDMAHQTHSVMALDLRSVMCIPLEANQQRIGVLYISSQAITKTFTPQDQSLLEAIANQAALTIRNAQLLDEQERQIVELERALQLVKEAQQRAVTDGMTGLYNHVYFKEQLYNSVLESERYGHSLSIVMVDLDHFKSINDTHGHQTGDEVLKRTSAALRGLLRDCDVLARYGGEELAVLLPQTDQPGAVVVAERIRQAIARLEIRSMEGATLGVTASLGVAGFRPGLTATELVERADRALYAAKRGGRNQVCAHGQTVEISTDEVRERRETVQDSFLQTVTALSEAVNVKDCRTPEDQAHVESWAKRLGVAWGLGEREVRDLCLAATLHDVGKIGVPDAILQKIGPLNPKEWEIMRTHPIQGARIMSSGNLKTIALAIRHHHERWDGTGYPDGLKGTEIPLAARMIAVLDAYRAMTTDRSYRTAMGSGFAQEELRKGAGSQFDPEVVEAFLELLES